MTVKVTNNAWGTLSVGINDTDTTLLLGTAQGDRFPSLPANNALSPVDYFFVTIVAETAEYEIVRVIERNNDVLTVVRAQDGTRRRQFLAGSRVELRPVAALFNSKKDIVEDTEEKTALKTRIDGFEEAVKTEFENVVHMGEQELTDEEKAQARENIDAMSTNTDEEIDGIKTFNKPTYFNNNAILKQRGTGDYRSYALIGRMAENDAWIIRGGADSYSDGEGLAPTQKDYGFLEIATADNGNEPIYVSQYSSNGILTQIDGENGGGWDEVFKGPNRRAVILDRNGNTQFPGKVTVTGAVFASYFQATSDSRLKYDYEEFDTEKIVDGITPYKYRRRDMNAREKFVGVIAQDVQKVLPEAVKQDDYGYLSVDYAALTAVLLGEIKRLKQEIKEIKDGMQRKEVLSEQETKPVQETRSVQKIRKTASKGTAK